MGRLQTAISILLLTAIIGGCATGTDALDSLSQGSGTSNGGSAPSSPSVMADARIHFAPVIGAPESAVTPLSSRLQETAAQYGFTVLPQAESDGYTLTGYFSAFTDGGETTVIYVWDVQDAAGNRLHRIQGRENAPAGTAEGWSSVTTGTMNTIADKTVEALATWFSGNQA